MRQLLFFLLLSGSVFSQSFSYSLKTFINGTGTEGPMKGVPGNLFTTMITFSNPSASKIFVVIDRYKNDHPDYWAICYCYFECHSPSKDSIMVGVEPFSSNFLVIQFKTDSVNPGIAFNSFNIFETGSENNAKKLHLTASTLNDVGISELSDNDFISFKPNPVSSAITIMATTGRAKIVDPVGKLIKELIIEEFPQTFDLSALSSGIYFIEVEAQGRSTVKKFVKD
jgi:hypothetical protein